MRTRHLLTWAALGVAAVAGPAAAEPDEVLGQFKDWFSVAFTEGGQKTCYMVSEPKKSEGDYSQRGAVYVQVTRRKGAPDADVVSFEAGYPFAEGAEVAVKIDNKSFTLFTHEGAGWAVDAETDKALVAAMRKGKVMMVHGTSARGTDTADRFSLFGFTRAHKAIVDACR